MLNQKDYLESIDIEEMLADKPHKDRIQRSTLVMEIANRLRDMILLEKLPPGIPLPEVKLAKALGISRTPLREAIRLLQTEGLIEFSSRTAKVADPDLEEIEQYLLVLGALEGLAGSLAAVNASDEELTHIQLLCDIMIKSKEKLGSLKSFRYDMNFHKAIVRASKNFPLIETHRQYNSRLWRARYISAKRKKGFEVGHREHRAIAKFLLHRDATNTAKAMQNHLKTTAINIKNTFTEAKVSK